ncbi:MAG: KpsF/GutQ family sugar-phosphate isomerase [Phycisphaerales bacterium]|nr:KpsF/GutQ family sugar-phosphate isomerase [Phycisphaerales bacterium]
MPTSTRREPIGVSIPNTSTDELEFITRVFEHEANAILDIAKGVDERYTRAIDLIVKTADAGGTVIVSGLGKSGHIGAKISATMASLGITSHAVHPTEAAHGDLGRFRKNDLAICLSHSGETDELVALASILRQDKLPIIAITRGPKDGKESSLQRLADVTLEVGVTEEAGDGSYLAPTSSTTGALAIGDALALAVARRRAFTNEDFHARHPGGTLGSLLKPVSELIRFHAGTNLPIAEETATVAQALTDASQVVRRPGALLVVNGAGTLSGIFTDSDLRRLILRDPGELHKPIGEVMTRGPKALSIDALTRDAVAMFREYRADEIPIVDSELRPVGLLDVQDLIAMKLVEDES